MWDAPFLSILLCGKGMQFSTPGILVLQHQLNSAFKPEAGRGEACTVRRGQMAFCMVRAGMCAWPCTALVCPAVPGRSAAHGAQACLHPSLPHFCCHPALHSQQCSREDGSLPNPSACQWRCPTKEAQGFFPMTSLDKKGQGALGLWRKTIPN